MTTKSPAPIKEAAPFVATTPKAPEGSLVAPPAGGTPLLAEVQSFIQRREELARKLAEEIRATEARLAELKRTAAALFPENAATAANKEKRAKKLPKAKPLPPKTEVAAPPNAITEVEAAASDSAG